MPTDTVSKILNMAAFKLFKLILLDLKRFIGKDTSLYLQFKSSLKAKLYINIDALKDKSIRVWYVFS